MRRSSSRTCAPPTGRIAKLPWMTAETKKAALRKLANDPRQDRLSRQVARLLDARDQGRRCVRQPQARGAFQSCARHRAPGQGRRSRRMGHGAANGERLLQLASGTRSCSRPRSCSRRSSIRTPIRPSTTAASAASSATKWATASTTRARSRTRTACCASGGTTEDERRFKELGDRLAEQYSKFEALPGLFVNGRLTLGENIGDLGGLNVALEAYKISLQRQDSRRCSTASPATSASSSASAQIWRQLIRDEALRNQVVSDRHSPAEFRANGTVRNMDEWYEAFGVQAGAKLYLPPDQRVRIW